MGEPLPPIADPMALPIAKTLLECLAVAMARVEAPPAVVCLRPGDRIDLLLSTLEDECCQGLAWVRVANFYASRDFPNPDTTFQNCSPLAWAVVLELGAARCAPRPEAEILPSCAEWTTVTERVLADAAAIRRALCCWYTVEPDRMILPGVWTPMTTEGGCVGGTMQVTVAAPACDCEPEAS